ncbi:hypothetical protein B0H14DRAFT_3720925 [Mycena olivaceomarginata]|nr:hypothetical protein B0H14DRAFT_3720925 [Mycena olivaceomarginata]
MLGRAHPGIHPGILILSLDGKEASYFNACRAALANYPCPKCLMHHSELHCITKKFKVRTTATMKAVVDKASNALTKTEAEAILKNNVLHGIKHFLLGFRFSDPYAAYSYDTLHSDDLGKWGHHLWPLLLDVIEELGGKGILAQNVLIHCLRAYQRHVSKKYGKDFDFFKQHATSHIVDGIFQKGTANHGSTRPGEEFQQEATEAYNQTSFKNVAAQMNRIAETQETIGRIWMAIDKYDRQRKEDEQDEPDIDETPNESQFNSGSWRFGSPDHLVNSKTFGEILNSTGHRVKDFDLMLCDFVTEQFPGDRVSYEQCIPIRPFKCAHITYQSLEDWRGLRDIVRRNPSFHGHPRYDSVLFNSDSPDMAFARLHSPLRCTLESKHQFNVALVRQYHRRNWKPRTEWAGCQVREEVPEYSFLLTDYVIRAALLTPVPGNDAVDTDMFLRADQY